MSGDGAAAEKVSFGSGQRMVAPHTAALEVHGELDLASAPQLKWALADLLASGATRLIIDLARVTFIDSTALGVLVGFNRNLPDGSLMAIVCANAEVLNIFELTGLDGTFEILPSFDDALAQFREDAASPE